MKTETVKVTIQVPKGIDLFIQRMAKLQGNTAKDWYQDFIQHDFDAIAQDGFQWQYFDEEKMKQLYDYEHKHEPKDD